MVPNTLSSADSSSLIYDLPNPSQPTPPKNRLQALPSAVFGIVSWQSPVGRKRIWGYSTSAPPARNAVIGLECFGGVAGSKNKFARLVWSREVSQAVLWHKSMPILQAPPQPQVPPYLYRTCRYDSRRRYPDGG